MNITQNASKSKRREPRGVPSGRDRGQLDPQNTKIRTNEIYLLAHERPLIIACMFDLLTKYFFAIKA